MRRRASERDDPAPGPWAADRDRAEPGPVPASNRAVAAALSSSVPGGKPLPRAVAAPFEAALGRPLPRVRLHAAPAGALPDPAVAVSDRVYVDRRRLGTEHQDGLATLGHEVAHVLQQDGEGGEASGRELEAEARAAGRDLSAGRPPRVVLSSGRGRPQGLFGLGDALYDWDPLDLRTYSVATVLQEREAEKVGRLTAAQVAGATLDQRYGLVALVLGLDWVGPSNEGDLERVWGTFTEDELDGMGEYGLVLWHQSADRGADLDDLEAVRHLQTAFERDVKAVTRGYLHENQRVVSAELARLGLPASATGAPAVTAETSAALDETVRLTAQVRDLQLFEAGLRDIPVGYRLMATRGGVVRLPDSFDPNRPPPLAPSGEETPAWPSWDEVNGQYRAVAAAIATIARDSPAVYSLIRAETTGAVAAAGPQEARVAIGNALRDTAAKIAETFPKLDSDDLDYRDLSPIHTQLFTGEVGGDSGLDWSRPIPRWAADDVLSDHERREFWISLGLGTLAAAAFVVAEIATVGSATFFIAAGVGLGAGALEAGMSWEEYGDLSTAAGATVSDDAAVVTQQQADAKLVEAVVASVLTFADAFQVARGLRAAVAARSSTAATRSPGALGRAGELARFEEVGLQPRRMTALFTKAERDQLVRQLADGEITLRQFADQLPAEGAEQVYFRTPGLGRGRFIDHVFRENEFVVLRESKNYTDFAVTEFDTLWVQLRKDTSLLDRHPEAIIEWRIRGKIGETTWDVLQALAERHGQRFRFQADDMARTPIAPVVPPTVH